MGITRKFNVATVGIKNGWGTINVDLVKKRDWGEW